MQEEDIISILVSTDNHLGFMERDQYRGDDSFAAFEEVLAAGRQLKADMVLLGGDLFHENKPSRRTLYRTMQLLRKYCLGHDPIHIELLSDQREHFANRDECVNYENPCYSVSLPVFAIHGNHDDPTRDGGNTALSALDVLNSANLINYVGKQDQVDDIVIKPLLIKKGLTYIALYTLGNVRDERLNRMWTQKKVRFLKPIRETEHVGDKDFYHMFVLHQNKNSGRGAKNCVHESMIPDWMDFVVWGNEHESEPNFMESLVGTFRILQPGSTIATSLVDAEARPKHMVLVQICGTNLKSTPYPLTQVRPFRFGSISLASEHLDPNDENIEKKMTELLVNKVQDLIADATLHVRSVQTSGKDQLYKILSPEKVLVRLSVEAFGFPILVNQRFGQHFLNDTANPSDILLFSKKKGSDKHKTRKVNAVEDEDKDNTSLEETRLEDLLLETLASSDKKFTVLHEKPLTQALEDQINRQDTSAVDKAVDDSIRRTMNTLYGTDSNLAIKDALQQLGELTAKKISDKTQAHDDDADDRRDNNVGHARKKSSAATALHPQKVQSKALEEDSESEPEPEAKSSKSSARSARGGRGGGKGASRGGGRGGRGKGKASALSDDDEDDEEEERTKRKQAHEAEDTPQRKRPRRATAVAAANPINLDDSDGEDDINVSDEEEEFDPRTSAHTTTRKNPLAVSRTGKKPNSDGVGVAASNTQPPPGQKKRQIPSNWK